MFFSGNGFFKLHCVKCKYIRMYFIRSGIININSNEPLFYPYSIKINKCSGSCNSISDPYASINDPLCVLDVVKNINVKVFNILSRTNETRHIE